MPFLLLFFKATKHALGGLSLFIFNRVVEKHIFLAQFAIPGQNNMTLKKRYEKLIDFSTSAGNKDVCRL